MLSTGRCDSIENAVKPFSKGFRFQGEVLCTELILETATFTEKMKPFWQMKGMIGTLPMKNWKKMEVRKNASRTVGKIHKKMLD